MKYLITVLTTFLFLHQAIAVDSKNDSKKSNKIDHSETRKLMSEFFAQIAELQKYFLSEDRFVDPHNSFIITTHLKELSRLAQKAKHDPQLNQNNFKFSQQVLESHILNTERIFKTGNKYFARWQLAATISVCATCHSQMPPGNQIYHGLDNEKMFSSTFEQAEFLFATRDFDNAFGLYDKVINNYKKDNAQLSDVETSLERELAYFSRITRDPTQAITKFKVHLKNKELPEKLKADIGIWIKQFEAWQKDNVIDPKTASEQQIIEYARKNIATDTERTEVKVDNPDLVTYLRTSSILYEYLQTHPKSSAVPDVLYWLAVCDRAISNNIFYSLADLYLKECVIKYPKSTIAKKCYSDYELEMISAYTNSTGLIMPQDVQKDLNKMRKLVGLKTEVKIKKP